ncbi:hypothetical protein RFI_14462, partial [Reticulomyxa filosa]
EKIERIRVDILKLALREMGLISTGIRAVRLKMRNHSREVVIREAGERLYDMIKHTGGFSLLELTQEKHKQNSQRTDDSYSNVPMKRHSLLSIVVGSDNEPTYMVLLNEFGDEPQCNESTFTYGIGKKNMDLKKFKEFVQSRRPSLIVIDASSPKCRFFKEDVEKVLYGIETDVDEDAAAGPSQSIKVELVDPRVSNLYKNSANAEKEFPSWPANERQAVSLGRYAMCPMTELCNRWCEDATGKNEILSLPFHSLMNEIPSDLLLNSFRRRIMKLVCEVGVRLNVMANRSWLSGPLQFVSGLGPHKASNLLYHLNEAGFILNRGIIKKKNI